ncbi:MAG: cyanophycinase [Proteobacteria bacterium]|nr:MAG: cyanophycinase [Pseudomonadota bacterium]
MGRGILMIIGGAEDKKNEQKILKEFVKLSGGAEARIVVMTAATQLPEELGGTYEKVFAELGVKQEGVKSVHIRSREEAFDESVLTTIGEATGVFFTGGSQFRLSSVLGGTKVDTLLHNKYDEGLVLAGTSAGASMMSSLMIIEGAAAETPTVGQTKLGSGLEFLPGVIIDQHFSQRGRTNRLLSAIARNPHFLGIGIDENTSIVVKGHICTVIGEGSITILDAGSVTSGLPDKDHSDDENISLSGVQLHMLAEGSRFNMRNRKALVD